MTEIQRAPPPPSPGEPRKPGSRTATKGSELEPPQPTGPVIASSFPAPWKLFPAPCPHLDSSAPTVCRPWQRNIRAVATTPTPQPLPAVWFPRLCSPKASNIPAVDIPPRPSASGFLTRKKAGILGRGENKTPRSTRPLRTLLASEIRLIYTAEGGVRVIPRGDPRTGGGARGNFAAL